MVLCLLLLLVPLLLISCGADVPTPEKGYFYDGTGTVSGENVKHILAYDADLAAKCGSHIAVLITDTTEGTSLSSYAKEVYKAWELGDGDILLVLALEDEDYWAIQGNNSGIRQGTLKTMLDQYLEPDFAQGSYESGILAIFHALIGQYEDYHSITVDGSQGSIAHIGNIKINGIFSGIGWILTGVLKIIGRLLSFVVGLIRGIFGWGVNLIGGVVGWLLSLSSVGIVIVVIIVVLVIRSNTGGRK